MGHQWSSDGERCVKCGDKDWIVGAECSGDTVNSLRVEVETLRREREELRNELERERMRLAACGTAALGYFDGCADEYKSASLDDVLRLRQRVQELEPALQAADEGRNYANQLLTDQSQRVRELEGRYEHWFKEATKTRGELAALRKRIDDAPVVA